MTSKSPSPDSSVSRSALEILCENLSDGLHATAQPLTILRASLGNPNLGQMNVEELRRLANNSAAQVARLCTLFEFLQKFVGAESTQPQLSATPILPLIDYAVEEARPLFEQSSMSLRSTVPASFPPLLIDGAMTLEALSNVLAIARAVSSSNGTVELEASSGSADAVQIVVRNHGAHLNSLKAEARLGLALAETNLRSQQATMSWSLQPFAVEMELRVAPEGSSADVE